MHFQAGSLPTASQADGYRMNRCPSDALKVDRVCGFERGNFRGGPGYGTAETGVPLSLGLPSRLLAFCHR